MSYLDPHPKGTVGDEVDENQLRATRHPSSVFPAYFGLVEGIKPVRVAAKFSKAQAYRGYSASRKALGVARFNSLLERDAMTLLEADPEVVSFAVEPHRLTYFMPSPTGEIEKREYTPDVVVGYRRGYVSIIDAKASFFRSRPEWQVKEPIIRQAYMEDHGVPFHVLTEHEIRAQPRLSNCQIILAHSRGPVDPCLDIGIRETLMRMDSSSIRDLQKLVAGDDVVQRNLVFSTVMSLVLRGSARIDLGVPLSVDSIVWEALSP